jgi:hypothetical protein
MQDFNMFLTMLDTKRKEPMKELRKVRILIVSKKLENRDRNSLYYVQSAQKSVDAIKPED